MLELRGYQKEALKQSLTQYRNGVNRQLMSIATGLGKTVIAASLRSHHQFTGKLLFLVHREELANQAEEKIRRWNPGLMVGVEMAGRYSAPMDTFVIASVPTLGKRGSKRIDRFNPSEYDCIIQDECHHGTATSFGRVYRHFGLMAPNPEGPLFLGITATPNRSDGAGLRSIFDMIVYDKGIDAGIRDGYLVDLRCWRVETTTGLDQVHTVAGDFNQGELADAVNTPKRNATIVKAWTKHAWDKRTLVFTVNVQHALDMAEAFKALGVPAAAVWGEDPERADKLKRMRNGELTVLCNCAVLTEGYDDPGIECIVLAKPTKSALLLTQMIGRGTRLPDGYGNISEVGPENKQVCCILDVADVTGKHQLCSVPSLLGMPKDLDMKGETYKGAKERLERVAQQFPTANLADLKDLSKLDAITKQIELFTVKYPVEIKTLTELAWRQQGDGYWLPVDHGRLTLAQDLRESWWIRGTVAGKKVEIETQNLAGGFNAADRLILESGTNRSLYLRDARWRDTAPSEKQVDLCRKLRIHIPSGATRGQVSSALDQHFAGRKV